MNHKLLIKKNMEFINSIKEYIELNENKLIKYKKVFEKIGVEDYKTQDLYVYVKELSEIISDCNIYRHNFDNEYKMYNQTFLDKNGIVAYRMEAYHRNKVLDDGINKFMNKSQAVIQTISQGLKSDEQILVFQGLFVNVDFASNQGKVFVYLRQIQFYVQQILQFNDDMKAIIKALKYLNCELEGENVEDVDGMSF